MNDKTFAYVYKDVSKKIPQWQGYGLQICLIFCAGNISQADEIFKKKYPEYTKKGSILSTVSVSIIK